MKETVYETIEAYRKRVIIKETIYETIEAYLESLPDSDLFELGQEMNRDHDYDCDWAWRMSMDEYLRDRAESVAGDTAAVIDLIEWVRNNADEPWIDYKGDSVDDEYFLMLARDGIPEMASVLKESIGGWRGVIDTYMAIDTNELQQLIEETDEWQREYGEDEED